MRLKSHVMIADQMLQVIESVTDIKLNKNMVRFGAVLPDIHPIRRAELHTPGIVADHYKKQFQRILKRNKSINGISIIVGMLTHYITDAFTLSHNIYNRNLKKHVQYEHLLDDLKLEIPLVMSQIVKKVEEYLENIEHELFNIHKHFEDINRKYLERVQHLDWQDNIAYDIREAIVHTSALMAKFLQELQKNNLPQLAF